MNKAIEEYYKLPENYFNFTTSPPRKANNDFFYLNEILCFGKAGNHKCYSEISADHTITLPDNLNDVINNLRLEKYIEDKNIAFQNNFLTDIYYNTRSYIPNILRHQLQKFSMRNWDKITFPDFPVDTTVENIFESIIIEFLKINQNEKVPFIWFWPDGKKGCLLMTHDVEEETGLLFCNELMDIDNGYNIRASFQLVPEKRYKLTDEHIDNFYKRGFEPLLHGLNHDGRLFKTKEIFTERLIKIHQYAKRWNISGFRSPIMYRNLNWYNLFEFKYDLSVPNNANIEPQKGGCCTVMPYKIFDLLEIPLTTIQDHPLYYYMNDFTINLWKRQSELILQKYGLLSFSIHPDYTIPANAKENYKRLLSYLAELKETRNLWNAKPAEIHSWWTARDNMELTNNNGSWEIKGDASGKARIAYMKLKDSKLVFELEDKKVEVINKLPAQEV